MTTPNRILLDSIGGLLHEAHLDGSQPIQCETCTRVLDAFAELAARGIDVGDLLPLVQSHIDDCERCRSDFEELFQNLNEG